MRVFFVFAAILTAFAAIAAPLQDIYVNSRYDFSISYPPTLLKAQPESDAGDGRVFAGVKSTARCSVFAGGTAPDINDTAEAAAELAEEKCPGHRASYRVVKRQLAAISCMIGTDILYSKTLLRGGVATTFIGTYPMKERARWDAVVAAMARSMTAGHFLK
jgi:hypothetical protein